MALQVTAFQLSWLKNLSVSQPTTRPQAQLAASEQGWTTYTQANEGGPMLSSCGCC